MVRAVTMGFQLGPKFLRKAPKGWLPARAYPVRHRAYEHHKNDSEGGETVIETSAGLTVTWRVEAEGHPPYEFEEERTGPTWLLSGLTGGGKRWYSLRIRPQYGLMKDVGVPGFVNPQDARELWLDWDRAYDEHVPAWNREARVQREQARRESTYDHVLDRVVNPFAGRLRPEDEARLDEKLEAERQQAATWAPPPPSEATVSQGDEFRRRLEELGRIKQTGRRLRATVVERDETERMFGNGIPVVDLTFELHDEGATRRVSFEHVYGPRHSERYQVGTQVEAWVDPLDPEAICPGDEV